MMRMSLSKTSSYILVTNLFFILLLSFQQLSYCITCPQIEKQSLLSFKQSLNDPSNLLSSWNDTEVNCCKWEGVFCSNLTGHVHQLHLPISYLSGKINPSLLNLKHLEYLDLSYNKFNQTIPSFIGSLTSLEYLNLSSARFFGKIPYNIGNLTSLNTFDLRGNELSGKIPREFGNLCKMKRFDLSENKLEGELSDSFGNMSDCFLGSLEYLDLRLNQLSGHLTHQFGEFKVLQYLDLGWNSLSGVIPNNIGNLTSLEYLFFGWNSLSGMIPNSIGNLSSLEYLYISDNKLNGSLPQSMGQLFNLKVLQIAGNMLEGVVTATHFAHLSNLTNLFAFGNHLTLRVDPNWIPPFKLATLRLGSWDLGSDSQIPAWLETQKNTILDLDLSCTGISGNVPSWFLSIQSLNLSHNQLQGKIPIIRDPIATEIPFRLIYLSSNNFSGSLPRVSNNLTELDLSNNSFSGDISHFLCDSSNNVSYTLTILHLGGNLLTGELPDCWMNWPSLVVLNLGNNNFSGTIPNSIGFLSNLQSLNLYGNRFSGRIPFSIQNCRELVKVDLTDNAFDGGIPSWLGTNLSLLKFLILRSNRLSGEITSAICQLTSLQILDLSGNKLSGIIPRCLQNFTAMATKTSVDQTMYYSLNWRVFLESASIAAKGNELNYDTVLYLVTGIDLSRNNLSGDIPKEITSLLELRSLNLSRNHFTGPIPESIGNMKQLESLDFSRNSLSGVIPSSFTTMYSLNYLNLSFNNLTGKIPESTQLRGFNDSCFTGNNLCGPPLTISCSKVAGPTAHGEDLDEEGDKPEIEWVYVFISLGYAVGLSGFLTTLYLKKKWRGAFYEFFEDMWYAIHKYFYVTKALFGRNL